MTLHRCPQCLSHFYHPLPDTNYVDAYKGPAATYHLLQGISLEFALHALSALNHKKGRLLDVGCGPGFVVDIWERLDFGTALGIEPSRGGDFARHELHRHIRSLHLEEDTETPDHAFDIVLSTEVLEHVSAPESFLHAITQKMTPDGMLIFSTPNVGHLESANTAPSHLIESLSPGYHVSLFSERALRMLLAKLELTHIQLIDHEGHWLVYASRQPLDLHLDPAWADRMHRKYLELASQDKSISLKARTILSYRLFRKLANEGDWAQTDALLPNLVELLPPESIPWLQPKSSINADLVSDHDLLAWMQTYFHLPALFFLLGIRAKNHLGDAPTAIQFFQLASRLARLTTLHLLEDAYTKELYWVSLLNAGTSLLESGQEAAGTEILHKIAISLDSAEKAENRMLPQLKFATRARLEIFRHQVQSGQWQAASLTLPALQGYLASNYSPSLLRSSGWLDNDAPWPEGWSPFWYFYCENMLALNLGRNADAAEGFSQLQRLCESKMPLPEAHQFLPLSREHAKIARDRSRSPGKFGGLFRGLKSVLTRGMSQKPSC